MKTIKKIIFLGIIAISIVSCSKSDVEPASGSSSSGSKITGSMKATLDGKAWAAKTITFGGLFGVIQVNGSIDDENLISLEFYEEKLELNKTYQFDNKNLAPNLNSTLLVKIAGNTLLSESGTFKITKYKKNSLIEGELNAELSNYIDKKASLKSCTFSMEYK